ncbi:hypothetical protein FM106_01640 [Brachybacterium faecium]|nr:hypothetical protein FM106_01640 [Brachybacterium faecium]
MSASLRYILITIIIIGLNLKNAMLNVKKMRNLSSNFNNCMDFINPTKKQGIKRCLF